MATAAVQLATEPQGFTNNTSDYNNSAPLVVTEKHNPTKHDVDTTLNFFKPNEDGSAPKPAYIGRPETYERPVDTHDVKINDVTGDEDKYTLDGQGFQFVPHVSKEKSFLDDEQIKDQYYKEVDQLLKDVYVVHDRVFQPYLRH